MRGVSLSKKLLRYHCSHSRSYATSTQTSTSTTPVIQEDFRQSVVVDESKGLFLMDVLRNSPSFRVYYSEIFNKNCDIKKMIREKAKDPAPKSIYEKTFIQLVDELANELTTAYLVARIVNELHPAIDWSSQGKHYMAKFKELEESLKNDMDIYDALRFSLKTDIGWIDSVDVRAIEAYMDEFREYGAHLDLDEDRKEQVKLMNRLAYTSETFLKNCQKTNDHIDSYNLLYGYLLGRLGGVRYDRSMVLDKEGLKFYHKFNLNDRPKNWKEFRQSLDLLRVTDIIVNLQENRRLLDIKPFLGVDRKKLVEDLIDKPAPAFTRWVYNNWLLEERGEQEFYLRRIVKDRHRIAEITGHESFAHRVQANTLLGSYDKVKKFLEGVIQELQPHVEPELEEIRCLTSTRRLEEADIQFALEASRYRPSLNHDLRQNIEKLESLQLENILQKLISDLQKFYAVKIHPCYTEKGESWESAQLKLEVLDAKDELLGAIYLNADIKHKALGRINGRVMLSKLNLDMEKDVEFHAIRKPKLLQNGELQTSISVVSFMVYDYFTPTESDDQPGVYLHPRTAKNLYREIGQAMRLILAQPRHQVFSSPATISSDLQELPAFFMEQLFYHTYSLDPDLAKALDETKYRFRALKTVRTAVNGLFDLELHGNRAFDYINDQTLTSTMLFHEIHRKALPQISLRKDTGPQHRLQDLAVRPAQAYSPLVAKSCASLIWKSQFESCPDFYNEQGKRWAQFQSKFGEEPAQDLLKSYFGFAIEPELLVDTLKNEAIRPTDTGN